MLPNDPQRERLVTAFKAGVPISEIAKDLRKTHRTVRRWIEYYGLQREQLMPQTIGQSLPQEAIDFIAAHYGSPGWTAAAIAKHLGLTRNTVIGRANRMGISAKRGRRSRKRRDWDKLPPVPPKSKCQYIHGDVTRAGDFSYCGADVAAGSYCHEHAMACYPLYRRMHESMEEVV